MTASWATISHMRKLDGLASTPSWMGSIAIDLEEDGLMRYSDGVWSITLEGHEFIFLNEEGVLLEDDEA